MRNFGRGAAVAIVAFAFAAACGGGGSGGGGTSKAGWERSHGQAVTAASTELDQSIAALNKGDQQATLGACTLLRDDVAEARKGLPVPDPASDTALRAALDASATAAADCVQGAQVAANASLNEKAMAELAGARTKLNAAQGALTAWR